MKSDIKTELCLSQLLFAAALAMLRDNTISIAKIVLSLWVILGMIIIPLGFLICLILSEPMSVDNVALGGLAMLAGLGAVLSGVFVGWVASKKIIRYLRKIWDMVEEAEID